MAANYVLLERIELNASAASVTFSNIPQSGYTDLKIVASARTTNSAADNDGIKCTFNGSTTGFTSKLLYGYGSGTGSNSSTDYTGGDATAAQATASTFGNSEVYIPNYTSSNYKSYSADGVSENNATSNLSVLSASLWSNTAAITSVTLTGAVGSFVQYSTFSLYGLAAVGTTPVIAPKASGGNVIETDGTYWYHAFLSTGAFVPSQALTCDALVVAGGGGAAESAGGGGGAGGLLGFSAQSFASNTSFTVTVGAGGAGVTNTTGNNGSNSQLGALTAAVGGGYGATFSNNGANGGSGGGAAGANTGGTATSGQGNNGGSGNSSGAPYYSGGGGGGSAAVGGTGTGSAGGNGGNGLSTYSSWGLATTTGQNVSGTVYYAGGGGGGVSGGSSGGTGGYGGGGAGGASNDGTSATTNTGGGGGGASGAGRTGGSGGSGIVIIRYTIA